jgi:predicted ATPase/DNA-binding CsgD family transcriptional regulator
MIHDMSPVQGRCEMCGVPLPGPTPSRYCSNACRQRAYRQHAVAAHRTEIKSTIDRIGVDAGTPRPAPRDRFVGRKHELNRLRDAFRQNRLVTLIGTGGVGKTRLAREFISRPQGGQPVPAIFVELESVDDGAMVAQAVADVLKLRNEPGKPIIETVLDVLSQARAVLVLDNCEHLIDACASFVDQSLDRGRRLKVLATSREALNLHGEVTVPLRGLPLHSTGSDDANASLKTDAVDLFVERAREVVPDFDLTNGKIRHVAAICAALDGVPLAIELAARWVLTLSVEVIRDHMDERFDLLTTGRRLASRRQQSLRSAIQWSYELLSAEEQTVFRQLCVMSGSFDLETAIAVCRGSVQSDNDVLAALARLNAVSLLTSAPGTDRYRFLESIRMYGAELLNASGEIHAAQNRLVTWLAAVVEPVALSPVWFPSSLLSRIMSLVDVMQCALRLVDQDDPQDHQALLALAISRCWLARGDVREGRKPIRAAIEAGIKDYRYASGALILDGTLACMLSDFQSALSSITEALKIARDADDNACMVGALYTLGYTLLKSDQIELATRHLTEGVALARTTGDAAMATVLERLVWSSVLRNEVDDQMVAMMHEATERAKNAPPTHRAALLIHTEACVELVIGDLNRAEHHFRRGLCSPHLVPLLIPFFLTGFAMVAERRGDAERSIRLFAAATMIHGTQAWSFGEPAWNRKIQASYDNACILLHDRKSAQKIVADTAGWNSDQAIAYALREIDIGGHAGPLELNDEERDVAELVALGQTNRDIAETLGISVRTVAYRVRSVRTKLGVTNRSDIAAWAAVAGSKRPG